MCRIVTLGLRNLADCFPGDNASQLVRHGENHTAPDLGIVAAAVQDALQLPVDDRLIFDCRDFHEHHSQLRGADDWGHCGLHPTNAMQ
jgi:hypothetical protein